MALAVVAQNQQQIIALDEATKARAREMFFPDVPDDVLNVVWLWCEMYKINPFAKHIVVLKFWNGGKNGYDYTPYITKDGVVAHAQESGLISSIQVQHGCEMATGEKYCTVSVYRRDSNIPYITTGFMSEWMPKPRKDKQGREMPISKFWQDSPRNMLAKTMIRHAVLLAVPLSIPVLDENSTYFNAVTKAMSSVVTIDEPEQLPELPAAVGEPVIDINPANLVDELADDETIIENQPPSTPEPVDPDALEKARADVHTLGEDVLGVAKWKTMKLALIRSVKATAESVDDLTIEELAKLTQTLVAKKLGAAGNRRM